MKGKLKLSDRTKLVDPDVTVSHVLDNRITKEITITLLFEKYDKGKLMYSFSRNIEAAKYTTAPDDSFIQSMVDNYINANTEI